ncbi:MAG: SF0329 family protein [Thermomicrobiales bacterium]
MQWSKLKKQIEDRFAESLHGRVVVHDTWYRHAGHDRDGRLWLTIDGQEIANFCAFRYWHAERPLLDEARRLGIGDSYAAASQKLNAEGVFSQGQAYRALRESLLLSIESMLGSSPGIIRALAMLDSRLGKRRLARFSFADGEIALVRACYRVRCEAEGIIACAEGDQQIGPPERYSKEAIAERVERERRFYEGIPSISPRRREEIIRRYEEETSNPLKSLSGTGKQ